MWTLRIGDECDIEHMPIDAWPSMGQVMRQVQAWALDHDDGYDGYYVYWSLIDEFGDTVDAGRWVVPRPVVRTVADEEDE